MLTKEIKEKIANDVWPVIRQMGDWEDTGLNIDDCEEVVDFVVSAYQEAVRQPPENGIDTQGSSKLKVTLYVESIQDDSEA